MPVKSVKTHLERTAIGKRGKARAYEPKPIFSFSHGHVRVSDVRPTLERILLEMNQTSAAWKAKYEAAEHELARCREELDLKTIQLTNSHSAFTDMMRMKDRELEVALDEKEAEHARILKRREGDRDLALIHQRQQLGLSLRVGSTTEKASPPVGPLGFISGPFHEPQFACCYDMSYARRTLFVSSK
jgi:hypothetical protein